MFERGPIYASDSALGSLTDIAGAIEQGVTSIFVGPDDAKAIRWALDCIEGLRTIKEWDSLGENGPSHYLAYIDSKLQDGQDCRSDSEKGERPIIDLRMLRVVSRTH